MRIVRNRKKTKRDRRSQKKGICKWDWVREAQKNWQEPMGMYEVGKNEMGQGYLKNEMGRGCPKNKMGQGNSRCYMN